MENDHALGYRGQMLEGMGMQFHSESTNWGDLALKLRNALNRELGTEILKLKVGEAIGTGLILAALKDRGLARKVEIVSGAIFLGHGLVERGFEWVDRNLPEV